MANFVEAELESLAEKVALKVLAQLQPSLVGLVDQVVAKVLTEVVSALESKLKA